MRAIPVIFVLCAATWQTVNGQEPGPGGHLYRGPLYIVRDAMLVEPEGGLPLEFTDSTLSHRYRLETTIRSRTLRPLSAHDITLRAAFGPTPDGMMTFRMRAVERAPEPPIRLTTDSPPQRLTFVIVPNDPYPAPLALKPGMKVVFTLERIESDTGGLIFENPDASELLWNALGRPSSREP